MALFRFRFFKPLSRGALMLAMALHARADTAAGQIPRASIVASLSSSGTAGDNTLPAFLRGNDLNAPPAPPQLATADIFPSGTGAPLAFPALPRRGGAVSPIFSFLPDTSTSANTTTDARNAQAILAGLAQQSPASAPQMRPGAKPLADTTAADAELRDIVAQQKEIFAKAEAAGASLNLDDLQSQVQQLTQRYDKLLRHYPNYVAGLVSYGLLLNKVGMNKQGAALMSAADNLDGRIPLVKNELGNYCAEQGHPLIAFAFYTAAIQLAPQEPLYYYQLGTLLTEARDIFLKDAPGMWTRDSIDEAMQAAFRYAMELAPGDWRYAYRYGLSYYDLGLKEWEDALQFWQAFEKKLAPGVEQQVARLHQAKVLIELRRPADAQKLLDTVTHPLLATQRDAVVLALNACNNNLAHPNPNIEITTGSADDTGTADNADSTSSTIEQKLAEPISNPILYEPKNPVAPPPHAGSSANWNQQAAPAQTPAPTKDANALAAAIAKLHAGMTKQEVLTVMLPVAPVHGVVYYGNTGTSRVYFQIGESQQLWVDMGGRDENFRSIMVGTPEPKRPWTRRQGDSIIVE